LQFILNSTRAGLPFQRAASGFPFQDLVSFVVPNFVSVWNPLYVGLLPVGLAFLALRHFDGERRFWAALVLIALVISFGTQAVAYDAAYWSIPGLGLFQGAERLALMVSIGLAVLAAHGAHDVFTTRDPLPRAWLFAALFALLFIATGTLTFFVYTATAPETWAALLGVFGRAALMAGLAFVVWRWHGRSARAWISPALFVLVVVIDLFSANRPLNVSAPYVAYPVDANVLPIQAEAGFFRVQDDARLAGHAGCAYGFREVDGVTPYRLAGYDTLLAAPESVRWALLGVKYVVSWRGELLDESGQRVSAEVVAVSEAVDERGNPTRTHRLAAEPQRAWLSRDLRAGETLSGASVESDGVAPVRVVSDEPGQITLTARVPDGAQRLLVLSEPYFPAWRVEVDGKSEALRSAHAALLAVALSPGEHIIEFIYQPVLLWVGGLISAVALLVVIMLPFLRRKFS
ncbi:MAG: YfhO family protein, partial [Anaerolineales bacterium]